MIGQRLGAFVVDRELGEGGVGMVYLAHRAGSDERVALKVLHPELAGEEVFLKRFEREARAADAFEHPNMISIKGSGKANGEHYIAYEYIDGGTLADALETDGALSERRALEITRCVADALCYASKKNVIHRDLKPENILLTRDGTPKLADLGMVKLSDPALTKLTRPGSVLGTPHYMAPEQARGEELDWRADQYALGLCLWTMLTAELPFDPTGSAPVISLVRDRLQGELPDVRQRLPGVSAGAARVLKTMTARQRSARYPTPESVIEDLDRVLAGKAPTGAPAVKAAPKKPLAPAALGPKPRGPVPKATPKRSPLVWIGLLLVCAALGALAFFFSR